MLHVATPITSHLQPETEHTSAIAHVSAAPVPVPVPAPAPAPAPVSVPVSIPATVSSTSSIVTGFTSVYTTVDTSSIFQGQDQQQLFPHNVQNMIAHDLGNILAQHQRTIASYFVNKESSTLASTLSKDQNAKLSDFYSSFKIDAPTVVSLPTAPASPSDSDSSLQLQVDIDNKLSLSAELGSFFLESEPAPSSSSSPSPSSSSSTGTSSSPSSSACPTLSSQSDNVTPSNLGIATNPISTISPSATAATAITVTATATLEVSAATSIPTTSATTATVATTTAAVQPIYNALSESKGISLSSVSPQIEQKNQRQIKFQHHQLQQRSLSFSHIPIVPKAIRRTSRASTHTAKVYPSPPLLPTVLSDSSSSTSSAIYTMTSTAQQQQQHQQLMTPVVSYTTTTTIITNSTVTTDGVDDSNHTFNSGPSEPSSSSSSTSSPISAITSSMATATSSPMATATSSMPTASEPHKTYQLYDNPLPTSQRASTMTPPLSITPVSYDERLSLKPIPQKSEDWGALVDTPESPVQLHHPRSHHQHHRSISAAFAPYQQQFPRGQIFNQEAYTASPAPDVSMPSGDYMQYQPQSYFPQSLQQQQRPPMPMHSQTDPIAVAHQRQPYQYHQQHNSMSAVPLSNN
ncbi:hypothetical protein BX616_003315, partial [Lobosporangium transversale]